MAIVFESLSVGDEVVNLVKPPLTKTQLVRYAGASGDFNPLHTDDEAARAAGFDGVVAHGMLMMGILMQAVTAWIPKRQVRKINVRFKGMIRPGDVITVTGRVSEKQIQTDCGIVTCSIEALDETRDVKVSGTFQVALPLED